MVMESPLDHHCSEEEQCTLLRVMVTPCNSGSRAFLQTISHHPDVHCFFQPIKAAIRENGVPDYSIYNLDIDPDHPIRQQHPARIYVVKESLGPNFEHECTYEVFPDEAIIYRSKPVFLYREPVATWNSWKKRQWGTVELFLKAYKHTYNTMLRCLHLTADTRVITQEQLLSHPGSIFERVCREWGFNFDPEFLNWKYSFKENPSISYTDFQKQYMETHGTFNDFTGQRAYGISKEQNYAKTNITPDEEALIELELRDMYEHVLQLTNAYFPIQRGASVEEPEVLRIA